MLRHTACLDSATLTLQTSHAQASRDHSHHLNRAAAFVLAPLVRMHGGEPVSSQHPLSLNELREAAYRSAVRVDEHLHQARHEAARLARVPLCVERKTGTGRAAELGNQTVRTGAAAGQGIRG